jgi:2-polyprenyl-3-methyl-5-hydroxy-6-metoxy-1,4-benzoquinol methylase
LATQTKLFRLCPVCGEDDAEAYLQKGDLRLVRCRRCAMIYANPVAEEFVSGQHYHRIGAEYYLSAAKLESDYAPSRFERELLLFRTYCRAGAVLDVGCSSGAFLFQLKQRFPDSYPVLGTDASGPPLDHAESRGIPVARGNFLEAGFDPGRFDAITFWAVLEHVSAPREFLQKAAGLLNPAGLCFALVPNMKSLAARLLGWRYRYIYPQHLNYFTAATLTKLVEPHFSIVELRSTHFNPVVLWQDWRRQGAEVSNQERAALLERTTAYKQNPLLRPLRALYHLTERGLGATGLADNLAIVLRKKAK